MSGARGQSQAKPAATRSAPLLMISTGTTVSEQRSTIIEQRSNDQQTRNKHQQTAKHRQLSQNNKHRTTVDQRSTISRFPSQKAGIAHSTLFSMDMSTAFLNGTSLENLPAKRRMKAEHLFRDIQSDAAPRGHPNENETLCGHECVSMGSFGCIWTRARLCL